MESIDINSIYYESEWRKLSTGNSWGNSYTFIVGRNATGKSRLLRQIVSEFIFNSGSSRKERLKFNSLHDTPSNIVAFTAGRSDKFPNSKFGYDRPDKTYDYVYLGNKNRSADYQTIGQGCINLMHKLNNSGLKAQDIAQIFEKLDFMPECTLTLKLDKKISSAFKSERYFSVYKDEKNKDFFKKEETYSFIENYLENTHHPEQSQKIAYDFREVELNFKNPLSFSLEFNFLYGDCNISDNTLMSIYNLIESKLIQVNDILFRKKDTNSRYKFSQASSGQQNIMLMLFGVTSIIRDGSLVCIDEPEISLHPQWQLEIIKMIRDAFDLYQRCHFFIATHSPQIVSGAPLENSFVLNLDTNEFHEAHEYYKKSSDYQLAEVFDSPGNSNEYLMRVLLVILARIRDKEDFKDQDHRNMKMIERLIASGSLHNNDPVFYLYNQAKAWF